MTRWNDARGNGLYAAPDSDTARPFVENGTLEIRQPGADELGRFDLGAFLSIGFTHHLMIIIQALGYEPAAGKRLSGLVSLAALLFAVAAARRQETIFRTPGMKETAFSFARVEYREGVMDRRDIRREASEWLSSAPRCAFR